MVFDGELRMGDVFDGQSEIVLAPIDARSMTVSVETLPAGSDATLERTVEDGAINLAFGIPQGIQGEQGEQGEGVPDGGAAGTVLRKASATDYDTEWDSVDAAPTDSSEHLITSGAVKTALDGKLNTDGYITAGKKSGTTLGTKATAEGDDNRSTGDYSHAEGYSTVASGDCAHAEGTVTTASGLYSHAEGRLTVAGGTGSHAEGDESLATAAAAHAEGASTTASGLYSHAEGSGTRAAGVCAHAEGRNAYASGDYSHASGYGTLSQNRSQHVFGEYNSVDYSGSAAERGNYVEIVGNGTAGAARSNARTLDWDGNETLAGKLTLGAAPTNGMDAATKKYVDDGLETKQDELTFDTAPTASSTNPVESGGVYTALAGKLDKTGGTMSGNIAMGGNKVTGLADGTSATDAVTKQQLDAAKLGALKPSGSIAFASLPALSASVLNNIYNITDAFTTTSDFVEGSGISYPAGTNVAVINTGTDATPVYKYDTYTGVIDLSPYLKKDGTVSMTGNLAMGSHKITGLDAPASDTDGATKKYVDDGLSGKQATLTFDTTPTNGSTNPVTSGGVKSYVDASYTIAGLKGGTTLGVKATAEGYNTTARGSYSHAEGTNTTASGSPSHAEGTNTTASGSPSHAEGANTTASGSLSHAEGYGTTASGTSSHAEGVSTKASGKYSHAEGYYTSAQRESQHVFGEYNVIDTTGSTTTRGQYVEIVGNGASSSKLSNARTLDWSGNETLAGKLTLGNGTASSGAPTKDADAATKKYVDDGLSGKQATLTFDTTPTQNSTNPVTSGGLYDEINPLKSAIDAKPDIDLGITGASVGEFAKIKTVDANGKPTEWEHGTGGGGINVMDAVLWRPPVNFGKKVNGVVGDNIKVYRSWADDKLVFLGSGEMYDGTAYNDPYLISSICGWNNTTVREIYIQEGITGIGSFVFNRFYAADIKYAAYRYWANVVKMEDVAPLGFTRGTLVLPSTITRVGHRAFQYYTANMQKLIILSSGALTLSNDAFRDAYFYDISIPNATEIYVDNDNGFAVGALRYFSVGGTLMSNLKFTSTMLENASLVNIANHLLNVVGTETSRTLTLESAVKTTIASLMGTVADDEFTASSSGTVSLQDFITTNRGWSIA